MTAGYGDPLFAGTEAELTLKGECVRIDGCDSAGKNEVWW